MTKKLEPFNVERFENYFQLDIEPKADGVTDKYHAQRRHTLRGLYSISRQL